MPKRKMKPGSGARSKALTKPLKKDAQNPAAPAAHAGQKRYGKGRSYPT